MFGGFDPFSGFMQDTWLFDGATWSMVTSTAAPSARADCMLAQCDKDGSLLAFGGTGIDPATAENGFLADTWVWDGSEWSGLATLGPSARCSGATGFHAGLDQMVIFGGYSCAPDTPFLRDTWVWSGGLWVKQVPQHSPSPRSGAAMTFDTSLNQLLLFGGGNGSLVGDTWVWDGSEWNSIATKHAPSARMNAGMTFHTGLGATVLFGGIGLGSTTQSGLLDDTWAFDGEDWTQLKAGAPPPGGDCRCMFSGPTLEKAWLLCNRGGKTIDATTGQVGAGAYQLSAWTL